MVVIVYSSTDGSGRRLCPNRLSQFQPRTRDDALSGILSDGRFDDSLDCAVLRDARAVVAGPGEVDNEMTVLCAHQALGAVEAGVDEEIACCGSEEGDGEGEDV